MDRIKIEIIDWEELNERSDRSNFKWFKFSNSFFNEQKFFNLTSLDKIVLIYIYCQKSKRSENQFELDVNFASHELKETKKKICDAIQNLLDENLISLIPMNTYLNPRDFPGKCRPREEKRREEERRGEEEEKSETEKKLIFSDSMHNTSLFENKPLQENQFELIPFKAKKTKNEFGAKELCELWNSLTNEKLMKVRSLSHARKKKAEERIKELPEKSQWEEAIKKINESSFCNGENDRGWKADFDFLIRTDSAIKALEGKYDNKTKNVKSSQKAWIEKSFSRGGEGK